VIDERFEHPFEEMRALRIEMRDEMRALRAEMHAGFVQVHTGVVVAQIVATL
jgi:hypothetical protein